MKNSLFSAAVFLGATLFSTMTFGKDLLFLAADPRTNTHQIGCNSAQVGSGSSDVYKNFLAIAQIGAWSVVPAGCSGQAAPSPGLFLTFGPYTWEVAAGLNRATFTLMAGTTGVNSMATLDAFCPVSATTLASRTINYGDFSGPYTPEDFSIDFDYQRTPQCPTLEFRVKWHGGGELHHIKTVVGYPKNHIVYPGDTPFISYPNTLPGQASTPALVKFHQVGCLDTDNRSWTALSAGRGNATACGDMEPANGPQLQNRFLTFGPYTNTLGHGAHWAAFTLKRVGNQSPSGYVDIFSNHRNALLGKVTFSEADFAVQGKEYDFTVPFMYDPDGDRTLEYRVFLNKGDLSHVRTTVGKQAPTNLQCASDTMCRTAPVGCVFNYPNTEAAIGQVPTIARRDHSRVALEWGPYGGEGSPTGHSCGNPRPFCVSNACSADPSPSGTSVVVDSNFYLERANQSTGLSPNLIFSTDSSGNRSVVFKEATLGTIRHSPYGTWAGSYDLPNTSSVPGANASPTYYMKVKFAAATSWEYVEVPGESKGALIWLQPEVSNGAYFNVQVWKMASVQMVRVQRCAFPGDTCEGQALEWQFTGEFPKTVYMSMQRGTWTMLSASGTPMFGTVNGQRSAITFTDPVMDAPWSTMDISVMNKKAVTLENVTISRGFIQ